jgi:hypothetical protein
MPKRRALLLLASAAPILAACVPVEIYYREDAPYARLSRDFTACEVSAVQQVPANTQLGSTPVYRAPLETDCVTLGTSVQCTTTGGEIYGGEVYSFDSNEELRGRVLAQCMAERGYRRMSLPRCTSAQIAAAGPATNRLPALGPGACVAPARGGWAVLNPA